MSHLSRFIYQKIRDDFDDNMAPDKIVQRQAPGTVLNDKAAIIEDISNRLTKAAKTEGGSELANGTLEDIKGTLTLMSEEDLRSIHAIMFGEASTLDERQKLIKDTVYEYAERVAMGTTILPLFAFATASQLHNCSIEEVREFRAAMLDEGFGEMIRDVTVESKAPKDPAVYQLGAEAKSRRRR